jgi:hypothetical protein
MARRHVTNDCNRERNRLAKFYSRSDDAVIRVFDAAGNIIDTHEQAGEFKEPRAGRNKKPPHSEARRLIVKCGLSVSAVLPIIYDRLRRRLVYFELGAHLLDLRRLLFEARGNSFHSSLLLRDCRLKILLLLHPSSNYSGASTDEFPHRSSDWCSARRLGRRRHFL